MKRLFNIFICLLPLWAMPQISDGGYPRSFSLDDIDFAHIRLEMPDVQNIPSDEMDTNAFPIPLRVGEAIPCDIDLMRDGTITGLKKGAYIVRLEIGSEYAKGLVVYYNMFSIPAGGRLYLYSSDKSQLIGAFTDRNNPAGGPFATEMILGSSLVIEYNSPEHAMADPVIVINQVQYIYRDIAASLKGQSGPCEVNVNCPEGANWQNEKRSVAKILLTEGGASYLCTGTLINNTRQDSIPYFLTARHCGSNATTANFTQWLFYFNYEAQGCDNPEEDPISKTITGCSLIAEAPDGISVGSDFRLLKLNNMLPEDYNPWFAGWDRSGAASPSGVGIHHPKGDIKKISTYTSPLVSTIYGNSTPDPNGWYWKVNWVATANGHGVTEGGSSGSAIFDNSGKVVGTLTGGAASCEDPLAPDYYGKFARHWESNGTTPDAWLRPWLDPENTGWQSIDGFGYGNLLAANFRADTTVLSTGGNISFSDLSLGEPEQWEWTFSGGEPSVYSGSNPGGVTYAEYGKYSVMLVVRDGNVADSLLKKDYIRVTPNVYPNPAHDYVILDFGRRQIDFIEVLIIDLHGRRVGEYATAMVENGVWKIQLDNFRAGTYILSVRTNVMENHLPLVIY